MAAIDVQLIRQESAYTNGQLTGQRVYHVTVELGDDSETARLAPGIPRSGHLFKTGSTAKVQSVRARNLDEDQTTYEVQVDYAEDDDEQQDQPAGQNPLDAPPRYSWGGSVVSEAFFRDESEEPPDYDPAHGPWQGKPCVNSAGEDFQQLPERQRTVGTLQITRNEPTYVDWEMETYKNTVNANPITIGHTTYPAGTLLMVNITANGPLTATIPDPDDLDQTVTVAYFQISYDIAKSVNGHDLRLEDRGLTELSTETILDDEGEPVTTGKPKPILGRDNQPVTTPYPLDGQGRAKPNATDPPAVLTFRPYRRKNWAALALDDPA